MMLARRLRDLHALLLLGPCLLLWPSARHFIESQMALHMLLEFPLLLACGWSACRLAGRSALGRRCLSGLGFLDFNGLTGALLVTLVSLFWMIPAALDASLMEPSMAAFKYGGWLLAGFFLAASWQRMSPEILLFFVGNMAWMLATVGLLYMESTTRLCANYLYNEQKITGAGLLALSLILGAIALTRFMRLEKAIQASARGANCSSSESVAPAGKISAQAPGTEGA